MTKLKRPDGELIEEYVTASRYGFEDGKLIYRAHDATPGSYTDRFCFCYPDGHHTRWYTERTAPKWLRTLWLEAVTEAR